MSKIIEKWGPDHQMKLAQEECRKLIIAIDTFSHDGDKRDKRDKRDKKQLITAGSCCKNNDCSTGNNSRVRKDTVACHQEGKLLKRAIGKVISKNKNYY